MLTVGRLCVAGVRGYTETLYFMLNFAVKLKCFNKKFINFLNKTKKWPLLSPCNYLIHSQSFLSSHTSLLNSTWIPKSSRSQHAWLVLNSWSSFSQISSSWNLLYHTKWLLCPSSCSDQNPWHHPRLSSSVTFPFQQVSKKSDHLSYPQHYTTLVQATTTSLPPLEISSSQSTLTDPGKTKIRSDHFFL